MTKSLDFVKTIRGIVHVAIFLILVVAKCCQCEEKSDFKVYWNIPTFMCRNQRDTISDIIKKYGIIRNDKDSYNGEKIVLFYEPGKFPHILYNSATKKNDIHDGGVPQNGNLPEHLEVFETNVTQKIKDPKFNGVAVIDFERWRPVFRQNGGSLKMYQDYSFELEQNVTKTSDFKKIVEKKFEETGKGFVEKTLLRAKELRPNGIWGYYGYPLCLNYVSNNISQCPKRVMEENDRLSWLFSEVGALLPSVYLQESIPKDLRIPSIVTRVREAVRIKKDMTKKYGKTPLVLVYQRYVYTDTFKNIDKDETAKGLQAMKKEGADGVILWGSSSDLRPEAKCKEFTKYLTEELGPAVGSLK